MIMLAAPIFLMAPAALAATVPATTLFSLPANASWFENLAYRASTDTVLATRLDIAQLWSISTSAGTGTILAHATGTTAFVCITQTHSSPDEFYMAGLNFTTTGVQPNSSALWELAFGEDGASTFDPAFDVPGMTLINGSPLGMRQASSRRTATRGTFGKSTWSPAVLLSCSRIRLWRVSTTTA